MAINPHHTIEEINGIRCSVVEKNITAERAEFLKTILEHNNFKVEIATTDDNKITIGITHIAINVLHALYARLLIKPDGSLLTPAYWYKQHDSAGFYWEY
jgi:hypothetical protein